MDYALQRGRARESAEMALDAATASTSFWLQRGRARESAEMTASAWSRQAFSLLQRGRARESAEIRREKIRRHDCDNASTGPRS